MNRSNSAIHVSNLHASCIDYVYFYEFTFSGGRFLFTRLCATTSQAGVGWCQASVGVDYCLYTCDRASVRACVLIYVYSTTRVNYTYRVNRHN